ncbi:MAG: hypothetical protein NTV22_04315, partial [bacterium]|nr:hypothetical protein [bacterium]
MFIPALYHTGARHVKRKRKGTKFRHGAALLLLLRVFVTPAVNILPGNANLLIGCCKKNAYGAAELAITCRNVQTPIRRLAFPGPDLVCQPSFRPQLPSLSTSQPLPRLPKPRPLNPAEYPLSNTQYPRSKYLRRTSAFTIGLESRERRDHHSSLSAIAFRSAAR